MLSKCPRVHHWSLLVVFSFPSVELCVAVEPTVRPGLTRRVQTIKIAHSNLTPASHLCARASVSECTGVRVCHYLFE